MLINRTTFSARKSSAGKLLLTLLLSAFAAAIPASAQSWSYAVVGDAPGNLNSSSPLTPASDGNLYWAENDTNHGSIFQITPAGVAEGIFPFSTNYALGAPSSPYGAMIQGPDGYLYGVAQSGGANNSGSFFKILPTGYGFTDLYDFQPVFDGGGPVGGLTLGSDGNFYGVSNAAWWATNAPKAKHPVRPASANGSPAGHHADGAVSCGSSPNAVFFQLTPAGVFTPLYCSTDNKLPSVTFALVQGSDSNFYGISTDTTDAGGVILQLTTAGGYTVLGQNVPSGDHVTSALAGGPDGKFYSTINGTACGSIFQWDPTNSYAQTDFADLNCSDAERPQAWQLYLASDGAFYTSGSLNSGIGEGAVVRMDMTGTITYPYDFVPGSGQSPYTSPVQNHDGTFFGTTSSTGGVGNDIGGNDAVVYSLTASPILGAPVTLFPSDKGGTLTLFWTVNNASPLTPPNCVALVNNSTGVTGWSGMVYGAFSGSSYVGSATISAPPAGTTVNYEIVCPSQGAASTSVTTPSAAASKTVLTIGPASSMITGTAATLTATVSRLNNCGAVNRTNCAVHRDAAEYPTGTVTFSWNNQPIGQATLSSGVATLPVSTTNLAAQSYSVTAAYSGSGSFTSSSDTETGTLTAIPTTVSLTVVDAGRTINNTGTITAGASARLTATVTASSGSAKPTGEVTFFAGSADLGSASLNGSGVATITLSSAGVPSGSYTVTAAYAGNRTHAVATSDGVKIVVAKAVTTTTLSAANLTVARNQPDQLTATVTSSGNAPTGKVHFLWNNYFICAAALVKGSATCVGAAPGNTAYGPYSVTAAYMGDLNNNTSTSRPTTVTVAAP